ncbi:MAG: hypothetical protein R2708_25295 [Vicinamibacterales bacterium]
MQWDRAEQPLPPSLYLTGKPAFFGDLRWPWVDPLDPTRLGVLPAVQRAETLRLRSRRAGATGLRTTP